MRRKRKDRHLKHRVKILVQLGLQSLKKKIKNVNFDIFLIFFN